MGSTPTAPTDFNSDGTKVLAAASLALNQAGAGSSPAGPTEQQAPVIQRRRHRSRTAATRVRVPRLPLFDSTTRVPGVIGSTTDSNPVSQGSSPWGRALPEVCYREPPETKRAHGPIGRHQLRKLEIRVRLPVGPLQQRWSCGLAAKAAPLQGDDRWFESTQDYFGPDTPSGRAARLKPGRLQVRVLFWALADKMAR